MVFLEFNLPNSFKRPFKVMKLNENVFVSLMVLVISLMLNKVIFKLSFTLSVMFSLISSRLLKAEKLIGTGKL